MDKLKNTVGTSWTPNNLRTLLNWVNFGSFMIEGLDISINECRGKIRFNTILGLALSTTSGTLSIAQYSNYIKSNNTVSLLLNSLFTLFTFVIAINTGYIKIYQIQERLEMFIKTKQEWTSFITALGTQLDLPIDLRTDALDLIMLNKEKYLNLMNVEFEMPPHVLAQIKIKMDEQYKKDAKGIIQKNHGLRIYQVVSSRVERLIGMLTQLVSLSTYSHNKDLLKIIEEYNNIDVEFGNIEPDDLKEVITDANANANAKEAAVTAAATAAATEAAANEQLKTISESESEDEKERSYRRPELISLAQEIPPRKRKPKQGFSTMYARRDVH